MTQRPLLTPVKWFLVTIARSFQKLLWVVWGLGMFVTALSIPGVVVYGFFHRVDITVVVTGIWLAILASVVVREFWDY